MQNNYPFIIAGDWHKYQKRMLSIFSLNIFVLAFITFSPTYVLAIPYLDCADCNSSQVSKDFSLKNIITQYELYCERSSYVLLMYITAFLGCISGSLILGQFGDLFGRQYIILCSIAISVFGLINQLLCVSLTHMVISTFITGFGVIGMYILIIVMINENCQEQKRQQSIMVMLMVWALGGVFAAFAHYQVNDWIVAYFYFALVPFIISFFLIHIFIYESPKFFVSKQRYDEALIIYNRISKINKRGPLQMKDIVADLPDDLGKVVDEEIIKDYKENLQNNIQNDENIDQSNDEKLNQEQNVDQVDQNQENVEQNMANEQQQEKQNIDELAAPQSQRQEQIKLSTSSLRGKADNYTIIDLFRYDSLRSGTIGFMIVSFYLHLFYYGGQFGINKIMKGYDLYFTGACVSFGEFIVNGWLYFNIYKLRRALSTNLSLIFSLIICLSFSYKQESLTLLMVQIAILRIFVTFAFGILSIYPNEFYPTEVRSLGSGFVYGIGILATILSPVVIFYGTQLGMNPYLFMGLISIISPIGGLYVKETLGIELQDKIQKNQKS